MSQLTESELNELQNTLKQLHACKDSTVLDWLSGAYFIAASQKKLLLADFAELRALFLASVSRPLTVREAQLCGVCRVCRGEPGAPFILNYGEEFAHPECLKK